MTDSIEAALSARRAAVWKGVTNRARRPVNIADKRLPLNYRISHVFRNHLTEVYEKHVIPAVELMVKPRLTAAEQKTLDEHVLMVRTGEFLTSEAFRMAGAPPGLFDQPRMTAERRTNVSMERATLGALPLRIAFHDGLRRALRVDPPMPAAAIEDAFRQGIHAAVRKVTA